MRTLMSSGITGWRYVPRLRPGNRAPLGHSPAVSFGWWWRDVQAAAGDVAEIETLLGREHQRFDRGAQVAGLGVFVAVPVGARGEARPFAPMMPRTSLPRAFMTFPLSVLA